MNKFHKNSQHITTKLILFCLILELVIGMTGCATTGETTATNKDDPYENINREIYGFNDKVDDYVAKPVADTYKKVTPDFVETGVSNFFNNLKGINTVLNDLLQAKFEQSGRDTGRFLMNSTLGMAGIFDVAKTVGLDQNEEDFEQTLAVWGVPQGSYIVLPFLGPITTRGIPGAVFDSAANPVTYVGPLVPIQALSMINSRANAEGALKFIDEVALDPYVFTRESFLQWRNHLASDGKTESSSADLLDIDAELSGDNKSNKVEATSNAISPNTNSTTNKLQLLPSEPKATPPTADAVKNQNTTNPLPKK